MRVLLWGAALALVGLGAWMGAHILPASGIFVELEEKGLDLCRRVDVAPGTEDIEIDEASGQVFISTFDRRGWYEGRKDYAPGAIYLIDLDDRTLTTRRVSPDVPADFSPHGISLWRGESGARRLFVVNHRADGTEAVEMFNIDENGELFHTESVIFEEMYSPNDVIAVGNRQFYATNDRRYDAGLAGLIETYLALPLTDIVYFDGIDGAVAAKGFAYPNGVNVSPDGERLYVAETLKRRIVVFARDPVTGALQRKSAIATAQAPDNIDVTADGVLYVAGHPKIFDFTSHAANEAAIAPSQVLRIDPDAKQSEPETVFLSLQGEINASSVGAVVDDTLIVGAVFDPHVMVCSLESAPE